MSLSREEVIRMAKESGFAQRHNAPNEWWMLTPDIERFFNAAYAAGAAAEREALLLNDARYRFLRNGGWEVLQDTKYWAPENRFDGAIDAARLDVAIDAAIRARGNGNGGEK